MSKNFNFGKYQTHRKKRSFFIRLGFYVLVLAFVIYFIMQNADNVSSEIQFKENIQQDNEIEDFELEDMEFST